MALSTYSELQASVLNWLARDSGDAIAAAIPDAIRLVEAKLNRNLRVAQMEATVTGTSTNGLLTLPTDFIAARRVEAYPYGPLELVMPDYVSNRYPSGEGGIPSFYTIQGTTLATFPAYTGEVTLDYYQSIPALSDNNPTNWLLASHPDVYLFLVLSEMNAFTKNAEAALLWNQRGKVALDEMTAQDTAKRYSNVSVRVKGPTP